MTLYDHAKKLYGERAAPENAEFWCLDPVGKWEWFTKAYDELVAERDRLKASLDAGSQHVAAMRVLRSLTSQAPHELWFEVRYRIENNCPFGDRGSRNG